MVKLNKKTLKKYKRSRSKYTKKYKKRKKRRYSKKRYSKKMMKGGAEDAMVAAAIAASLDSQRRETDGREKEAADALAAAIAASLYSLAVSRAGGEGKANGEILSLVREYGPRLYDRGIRPDDVYGYIDHIYKKLSGAPGNTLDNTKQELNERLGIKGGKSVKGKKVIDASSPEAMHNAVSKVGTFHNDPGAVVHKRSGGNYKYENVQGDGACLFRAILFSESPDEYRRLPEGERREGRWAESFALRQQSIEWNLKNWDRDILIRETIPVIHQHEYDKIKDQYPDSDLDDKEAYKRVFTQQHIYGDEPEIRAACNVIGKPIIVYKSYMPDHEPTVHNPQPESIPNSNRRGGNDVVRILHIGNHYLAILPE